MFRKESSFALCLVAGEQRAGARPGRREGQRRVLRRVATLALLALLLTAVVSSGDTKRSSVLASPLAAAIVSWEYDQVRPAIAFNDAANQYLVVWEDHHWAWGADADIYGQRLHEDGSLAGPRISVSWEGDKHRLSPDAAYDSTHNRFLVVWEYAYTSDDHDIYARLVNWDGSLVGDAFPVSTVSNSDTNPVVAYSPFVDEFFVVWERRYGSGEFTQHDIWARRVLADGTLAGAAFAVAEEAGDETAPAIAVDTENHQYLAVWDARASAGHDDIRGRRIGNDGSPLGPWISISTWSGDQQLPRVAYNRLNDQFLVAWQDLRMGSGWDVYGQRVNSDGSLSAPSPPIAGSGEPQNQTAPDVTYDAAANAYVVVWERAYSDTDLDVYRRVIGSDGSLTTNPGPVAYAGSYEGAPAVAAGLNRSHLLAWEDGRNLVTMDLDIYGEVQSLSLPVLSGRVYEGEPGDESTPLANVTVELHCSTDDGDQGWLINRTTTDSDGWYGLVAGSVCDYYNIVENDPAWYTSAGATSVDGTSVTDNWIQYEAPLDGKILTGNKFWDVPPPTTTQCNSCDDCSAKLNGSFDVVELTEDLTGVSGSCVDFQGGHTTFDCQGHEIQTDDSGEFDYAIELLQVTDATVRNCRISGFETGIRLSSASSNSLISNTITSTGSGIYLHNADGNELVDNHVTGNDYGVSGNGADVNSFAGNVLCQQSIRDMNFIGDTTGNTRSGNTCNSIQNWNTDGKTTWCDDTCTGDATTTCASAAGCQGVLDGGYGTIWLDSDVNVPDGLVVEGDHLTLDCQGHALLGAGSGSGLVLDNRVNVTVRDCTIQNYVTGIQMASTAHSHVLSSRMRGNEVGIWLGAQDPLIKAQDNVLSTNTIRDNAIHGVVVDDAVGNTINANQLGRNGHYGLWVTEDGCDNDVTNNVAGAGAPLLYWHDSSSAATVPAGSYGEVVFCNVQNATVENLTMDNGAAQNDGILLVGSSDNELAHNTLARSRGIRAEESNDLRIHHNDISHSASEAIRLYSSLRAQVDGNTLSDNDSGPAVLVGTSSHHADLTGNTIQRNHRGIEVTGADYVVLQGNSVAENTEEGVNIREAVDAHLQNNKITQNDLGLMFENTSSGGRVENNKICYNASSDIYDNGLSNTGNENTCALASTWRDEGIEYPLSGCDSKCVGFYQYHYGYSFENPSQWELDFGCPFDACQGDYVDTFGDDEVYVTEKVCIGVPICIPFVKCWCGGYELDIPTPIPDPHASTYYGLAYWHAGQPGECTGMSTTSLQFYHRDRYLSNYDPYASNVSDLTRAGDVENIIDAEHGAIVSAEIAFPYLEAVRDNELGVKTANQVLDRVKQAVDGGELGSLVIHNFADAHTVVATNYRDFGDTAWIFVYDSNIPKWSSEYASEEEEYPHIIVDKLSNTWWYTEHPEFDTMWFLPYSVSNGDFTIPLSLNHVFNWGSADAGVEDDEGNEIRWVDGELVDEIVGAAPVPAWGRTSYAEDRQGYMLPQGDYTVRVGGREIGPYTTTVFAQNSIAVLSGWSTGASSQDTLIAEYEPGDVAAPIITLETGDAAKAFSLLLAEKFGAGGTTRVYSLENATVASGAPAVVRISSDYNALIYTNRGDEEVTYGVIFRNTMVASESQVGDTLPEAVHTGLVIGPMESHILRPDDWLNLSSSGISVAVQVCTDGVCGEGEDSTNCPEDCPEAPACVVPHDDMHLSASISLCPGTYRLPDEGERGVLIIDGDDVAIDCRGARLEGDGSGVAILGTGSRATVENCQLMDYGTGVRLVDGSKSTLRHSAVISSTGWAVTLEGTSQSRMEENVLRENANGVYVSQAIDTSLEKNMICPNSGTDLLVEGGSGNVGRDNACDEPVNWHDSGQSGCRFQCASSADPDVVPDLYLPLVMRSGE